MGNHGHTVRGLLAVLLVAASSLIGAGLLSSSDLRIIDVSPHVRSGILEQVDVRIGAVLDDEAQLVFSIDWAGNPQTWREVERRQSTGNTTVSLVPESPIDIPPVIRTTAGLQTRPFRVRVNRSGESLFSLSDVISPSPTTGEILNGSFRHWTGFNRQLAPLGWSLSTRSASPGSALANPIAGEAGFSASISQPSDAPSSWLESSIYQTIPMLANCYEVTLQGTNMYSEDIAGGPASATGVQITQGDHSAWWVMSEGPSEIDRRGNVTIIEVELEPDRSTLMHVDISSADDVLRPGGEAVIKLFNASALDGPHSSKTLFESIEAKSCIDP
jgi:hypothetical protein